MYWDSPGFGNTCCDSGAGNWKLQFPWPSRETGSWANTFEARIETKMELNIRQLLPSHRLPCDPQGERHEEKLHKPHTIVIYIYPILPRYFLARVPRPQDPAGRLQYPAA